MALPHCTKEALPPARWRVVQRSQKAVKGATCPGKQSEEEEGLCAAPPTTRSTPQGFWRVRGLAGANLSFGPDYHKLMLCEMERISQLGAPGPEAPHSGEAVNCMFRQPQEGEQKPGSQESRGVDWNPGGDRKSDTALSEQGSEEQQQAPALVPAQVPQPKRRRPRIQYRFTEAQLQDLESAFQKAQYPDLLTR